MASSAKRRAVGLGENPEDSDNSSEESADSEEEDSEASEEEINEVQQHSAFDICSC